MMTQSHVLIGGQSTFFSLAAHLCDACVVISQAVSRSAEIIDEVLGMPWPRAYELIQLQTGDSAAQEHFDGETFGRALAGILT